jgi:hypothetical protein
MQPGDIEHARWRQASQADRVRANLTLKSSDGVRGFSGAMHNVPALRAFRFCSNSRRAIVRARGRHRKLVNKCAVETTGNTSTNFKLLVTQAS